MKERESKRPRVEKTNKAKLITKCIVRDSTKLGFIKKQEASRLSSSLGLKTPLTKIC